MPKYGKIYLKYRLTSKYGQLHMKNLHRTKTLNLGRFTFQAMETSKNGFAYT